MTAVAIHEVLSETGTGYADSVWPFVSAMLVLVLAGAGLAGVVVWWLGREIYRPPRMVGGRALARLGRLSPRDIDLEFDELWFDVFDRQNSATLKLSGWRIPHPTGSATTRSVLLLHSYGDSKIGALAWAGAWLDAGFHVILLDLRAHGESEGRHGTGGIAETQDVLKVIREIGERFPTQTKTLLLAGISFGGMIALSAAARAVDEGLVAAVVADNPVKSWPAATGSWSDWIGLPLTTFQSLQHRQVERRLGEQFADFSSPASLQTLARAGLPTLLIAPTNDPFLADLDSWQIDTKYVDIWRPACGHNEAINADPAGYQSHLETLARQVRETQR